MHVQLITPKVIHREFVFCRNQFGLRFLRYLLCNSPSVSGLIDDARRENLFGLLMSLNMLIEFGDAFDYSAADFRGWCSQAAFKRFETSTSPGPSNAAIAYK